MTATNVIVLAVLGQIVPPATTAGQLSATNWLLLLLLLGGFLGLLGQGLRVIPGPKKVHDRTSDAADFAKSFQLNRLLMSLFIGFIAGALAVIAFMETKSDLPMDRQMIVTLIGAGYAGTDFIEGLTKKFGKKNNSA